MHAREDKHERTKTWILRMRMGKLLQQYVAIFITHQWPSRSTCYGAFILAKHGTGNFLVSEYIGLKMNNSSIKHQDCRARRNTEEQEANTGVLSDIDSVSLKLWTLMIFRPKKQTWSLLPGILSQEFSPLSCTHRIRYLDKVSFTNDLKFSLDDLLRPK